jgi:hypothetical protein
MATGDISDFARELLRTDSLKVDHVLQEVREVLDRYLKLIEGRSGDSLVSSVDEHRARQLAERLRVGWREKADG